MEDKRFSVSEKVLNAVLNFLATKPFNEVVNLINGLQQDAKPLEEGKTEEEKS